VTASSWSTWSETQVICASITEGDKDDTEGHKDQSFARISHLVSPIAALQALLGRVFSQALYKSLKFNLFFFINNNSLIRAYVKKLVNSNIFINILI
jgi:hypothetical protein